MANPRKFSEKIALHTQKQAEETAAFEKIMREVSDATSKGNPLPKQQHLRINQSLGSFRGGSLPNVNNIANNSSVDLKSALSNLEEMKTGRGDGTMVYRERGRSIGVGVGPMRSRPVEKRIDTSPYASGPYLSPPPTDTSWRRTNSDSALHTSAQATDSLHSPGSQRRVMEGHIHISENYDTGRRHLSVSPDGRPRSCCEVPRVPGINIHLSQQEPGTVQIPIGNNTGSLPDLTSFHFPSPLPTPLDQEDHNSSTYSNSPQGTSPSTLSPTSRPQGRFSFGGSPPNESPGPPLYSPLSPHSPPTVASTPGVTLDNSSRDSSFTQQQQAQQQFLYQQHQPQVQQRVPSPQQSPCSPLTQTSPLVTDFVNSLNSYRSPQPVNRPSPQNSPGLTVKYGNVSPLSSSPQSPSSPSSTGPNPFSEHNSYFMSQAQANALQQHFEQFSMMDSPLPGTVEYIGSTNTTSPYSQADDTCTQVSSQELTPDPGYFSTSPSQQLQYSRHSAQTTPNTPSSIPDIVLTDFSNDDLAGRAEAELAKELGCAMAGSFDTELFPSDECLREGLVPIDLDGLQMLTDPEIITDPATEDHFRLDRL